MSHQRTVIRNKIRDLLIAGNTAAADKVFANRVVPIQEDELPCITVYTNGETAEIYNTAPRELERRLSVVVEIANKVEETIDESLDDLAKEVEYILDQDDTVGGTASDIVYQGSDLAIRDEGENLIGALRLTYEVKYYTYQGKDPETIEDFTGVDVTWDMKEGDDNPDTTDSINLEVE